VKKDEIGRSYGMHRREDECIQGFGGKTRRKEITMRMIDGRRIVELISEN
jgi:hypothetical protein